MSFLDNIWDKITDIGHAITGIPTADEKRNLNRQVADQIEAYKKQSELTTNELNKTRAAQEAEKRRINEKQIRGLRNQYRASAGFLNNQLSGQNSGLGAGPSELPNKLGNA